MHIKTCNNIYSHNYIYFHIIFIKLLTETVPWACVWIHKNLNSFQLLKAQVQIHYYLQRIRKNEPTDIQDKGRTCRHLFLHLEHIHTFFSCYFGM